MSSKTISIINSRFVGRTQSEGQTCLCSFCFGLALTKLFLVLGFKVGICGHHLRSIGVNDKLEEIEVSLGE